jgi:L-asparaginase II
MPNEQLNQRIPEAAALVEVRRGPIVESRHRGHLAVVAGDGKTIAELGSPDTVTYLRSSGKPFQTLPLVASGAADRFGFATQEIAIACGSHSGEPIHVETVRSMLQKIGLDASALKCGVHVPFNIAVARELAERGEQPSVLQNNCSGKHAGMLALALHLDAPTETYDQSNNPVQQEIVRTVSEFAGDPLDEIAIGTDGCGVPVFGVSVRSMALMYARLVNPPDTLPATIREACRRVVTAMIEYPEMVGGTVDRLDTELIRIGAGTLISKVGAEGVYTVGVLPCEAWPAGLGLALKIEDGDNQRARPPAVIEALRQMGVLDDEALAALAPHARSVIKNHRGDHVGEVRACFTLKMIAE